MHSLVGSVTALLRKVQKYGHTVKLGGMMRNGYAWSSMRNHDGRALRRSMGRDNQVVKKQPRGGDDGAYPDTVMEYAPFTVRQT
jgi:hypothetical protein